MLADVSSGVQNSVRTSRKATVVDAIADTTAPLTHSFNYAAVEV